VRAGATDGLAPFVSAARAVDRAERQLGIGPVPASGSATVGKNASGGDFGPESIMSIPGRAFRRSGAVAPATGASLVAQCGKYERRQVPCREKQPARLGRHVPGPGLAGPRVFIAALSLLGWP
jgi:hypothetical protein